MKQIRLLLLALLPLLASAQVGDLPRSTPAAEGVSIQAVVRFIDSLMAVPRTHVHHVMVLRHGRVVAEVHPAPFRAEDSHTLYSCSKTFVALAVGKAIDENRLRLTDRVAAFFPERLPDSIGANLAAMTVRDLLVMASGITPDWEMRNSHPDWISTWLAKPVKEPGKNFAYDSLSTFLLSAIVQRVTGMTTLQYLQSRFFDAMHITQAEWEQSPDGINTGGWGLRVQAETLAKLGLLINARGKWQGRQLVSEQWIEQATSKQIECAASTTPPTDGNQGYCYQMWRSKWPGSIRADGALAQYVVMVPQEDLVVVINSLSHRGHDLLACIWNYLMPGLSPAALAPEPRWQKRLDRLCATAALPAPKGRKNGRSAFPCTIEAAGQPPLTLSQGPDGTVTLRHDGYTLPLTHKQWAYDTTPVSPPYTVLAMNRFGGLSSSYTTAGTYVWTGATRFEADVHWVDWISFRHYAVELRPDRTAHVTITDNLGEKPSRDYEGNY